MDLHARLRQRYSSAIKTSCNKEGCKLKLDSLSSYHITIIDADKYAAVCDYKGRLCDYFLFLTDEGLIVVVVEMKSGRVDARIAVEQISNGAEESEELVRSQRVSNFYPILLSGRRKHSSEVKVLRNRKVKFQGEDYGIIMDKCGARLRDIIESQ